LFYANLSPYSYAAQAGQPTSDAIEVARNVGWLDDACPSHKFIARLLAFCHTPINATLGFHECTFCNDESQTYLELEEGGFGHPEIWIFGPEGKTYAAPTLIYTM
jgi:hypothetical protein